MLLFMEDVEVVMKAAFWAGYNRGVGRVAPIEELEPQWEEFKAEGLDLLSQ